MQRSKGCHEGSVFLKKSGFLSRVTAPQSGHSATILLPDFLPINLHPITQSVTLIFYISSSRKAFYSNPGGLVANNPVPGFLPINLHPVTLSSTVIFFISVPHTKHFNIVNFFLK
jgi:hypothetical protein